ncbi:nucleotidyltransferase family protein [Dendronalium sp. ChiSLP03b]|uniref:nucleotidyltransferase domain-containing protein n=1 Tax=Dendronalium sp. ChiSLP03b TaxID=3075381 RepID=UPI002AD5A7CE|nr:nucleotidyltransferase family protein [Dendronalium sp. ChiSLP03b]MDZ8202843.1 nucleotidyltransferase family protein [Dendronalium sp. ChiSLP03b]
MNKVLLEKAIRQQNTNIRPEIKLLLCCTRTFIDEENSKKIKILLKEDIDWKYLLEIAYWHRVLPLLFLTLNNTCSQFVPTDVLIYLQRYYFANAQRSLFKSSKLVKILNIFEENAIPVIPFKGPVLAATTYGDIARRTFGDLDLLVHRKDFLKTKEILMAQGFEPYADSSEKEAAYLKSLTVQEQNAYLRSHWELHLNDSKEQITLDVHQGILSKQFSATYNTEWIWKDTKVIAFADKQILSFSAENLIIILCSQGGKDCWRSLNRICDLSEAIRTYPQVNWEKLWQRTTKLRMRRMLLLGLSLAHELLDAEVPETIIQKIADEPVVKSLYSQIIMQFYYPTADSLPNSQLKIALFHLKLIEHPWDKTYYCYEHIVVPTIADRSFVHLPKFLSFLYYLIRPIRLMTDHIIK